PELEATAEVDAALRASDVVFHSVADDRSRRWIRSHTSEAYDLNPLYEDGRPRIEAYRAMAELVVARARGGERVLLAVYGHPCFLHTGVQLTVRTARAEGLAFQILPGLSSIDGLFARIGVDPGFGGLQMLEASDLMMYGRQPQTEGHVVILQVAIVGPRVHLAAGHSGAHAEFLIRRLEALYPTTHPALHFRLAAGDRDDELIWSTVGALRLERWTNPSSLYLPPARQAPLDQEWVERFGAPMG
ncbi:MAG: hypothetical protein QOJ29_321, partial [Thermoleophilaceae bacterium]|nr:hypothetical protein [Thermoleophilaceae bacterium]